jgi:hypothetical protein
LKNVLTTVKTFLFFMKGKVITYTKKKENGSSSFSFFFVCRNHR